MDKYDRPPEHCAILPAMNVVVGETDSIAEEKAEYLNSLVSPELSLATTSAMLGADISKTRDEKEFVAAAGHQGHGGSADRVFQIMAAEKISFAEAARRPRNMVVGSPTTIADYMQEIFEAGDDRGIRPHGRAGAAAARLVPHRICRPHHAGKSEELVLGFLPFAESAKGRKG
jgi:alkanesulfonate monooxygenase SsuD/methylene tetrahydromethanopterin reductase-like flavin-dependent oxidoreductase (luciferase family)